MVLVTMTFQYRRTYLDLFNEIVEMQVHKGQEEIKPLFGFFKKLSVGSNPAGEF